MKIKYFEDTDTALLEFGTGVPKETRELSEDVYLDFDDRGHVRSITLEHASQRSDMAEVSLMRMNRANQVVQ